MTERWTCPVCGGCGELMVRTPAKFRHWGKVTPVRCDTCDGTGAIWRRSDG